MFYTGFTVHCTVYVRVHLACIALGATDIYDALMRTFASELQLVLVSVEYRLAPEHLYPAQLDDCFAALRHLMRNAHKWHIDPTRIAVAGLPQFACPY